MKQAFEEASVFFFLTLHVEHIKMRNDVVPTYEDLLHCGVSFLFTPKLRDVIWCVPTSKLYSKLLISLRFYNANANHSVSTNEHHHYWFYFVPLNAFLISFSSSSSLWAFALRLLPVLTRHFLFAFFIQRALKRHIKYESRFCESSELFLQELRSDVLYALPLKSYWTPDIFEKCYVY